MQIFFTIFSILNAKKISKISQFFVSQFFFLICFSRQKFFSIQNFS